MAGPNVLLIGAARSGTTALVEMLRRHPEFSVAEPKEVHFFAHHGAELEYGGPGDAETIQRHIVLDPVDLSKRFDGSARFRIDGSVSTLYRPDVSIPNIRRHAARDAKLLVLLREPAARSLSAYQYLRARGYESERTFQGGLDREHERLTGRYHHMWHYRGMSRYREQIEPFVDAFPGRIHVAVFEEFVEDMTTSVETMLGFLGASPTAKLPETGVINAGGEVRSVAAQRGMRFVRRHPALLATVRSLTSSGVRERVRSANLANDDESAERSVLAGLHAEFAEDRAYISSLLGRSIPAWEMAP